MPSDSDASCPSDDFFGDPVQPIAGTRTFHQIATYVSGGCTALTIILCFGLCLTHLSNYRIRTEQRQIARIVLTPAIISLFDFLAVAVYDASGFLNPIGEYYDALALVSLYLLFVTYATQPERRGGGPRALFESLPELYAQHSYQQVKKNELGEYYRTWFFVFQIIPVRFITMIASMAVHGTVCKQLEGKNRANTIVSAITTVSTILCFLAVIRMMRFLKPSLQSQKPVLKTIALKGLVAFAMLTDLVFSILKTAGAIHPTATLDKKDWFIGLPNMMICCAGLVFAVLIVVPYRATPYTAAALPGVRKHSFIVGLIDVLNFTDIVFAGLSCLPAAFGNWRNGQDGGARVSAYQQKEGGYGAPDGVAPVMMPPQSYGQVGRRAEEEEFEMGGR